MFARRKTSTTSQGLLSSSATGRQHCIQAAAQREDLCLTKTSYPINLAVAMPAAREVVWLDSVDCAQVLPLASTTFSHTFSWLYDHATIMSSCLNKLWHVPRDLTVHLTIRRFTFFIV